MLVDAPRRADGAAAASSARSSIAGRCLSACKYDRSMVAAQIADGLARARELRIEYAAMLAYQRGGRARHAPTALVPLRRGWCQSCPKRSQRVPRRDERRRADERRVALSKGRGDVPWLSGIKVSWGPELELINISSTGVLVETGSKFAPGSTTELHLCGPETNLVVPVRFIRSDVARIDGLGVRYRAAAAFAKELDLAGPRRERRACRRHRRSSRRSSAACSRPPTSVASPRTRASPHGFASSSARATCRCERGRRDLPADAKRSTSTCLATTGCARRCRSCSTAITRSPTPSSGAQGRRVADCRRPRAREARSRGRTPAAC